MWLFQSHIISYRLPRNCHLLNHLYTYFWNCRSGKTGTPSPEGHWRGPIGFHQCFCFFFFFLLSSSSLPSIFSYISKQMWPKVWLFILFFYCRKEPSCFHFLGLLLKKHHNFSDLQQQNLITLQFWSTDVHNRGAGMVHIFWKLWEGIYSRFLTSFSGGYAQFLVFLACSCITPCLHLYLDAGSLYLFLLCLL